MPVKILWWAFLNIDHVCSPRHSEMPYHLYIFFAMRGYHVYKEIWEGGTLNCAVIIMNHNAVAVWPIIKFLWILFPTKNENLIHTKFFRLCYYYYHIFFLCNLIIISFNLKIVVNIINNQQRGNPQVIFSNVQHQEPMKKKREGRSVKL